MWIVMTKQIAEMLMGMYSGSLFMPIKIDAKTYVCSIDNLSNPSFEAIKEMLASLPKAESVEFPQDETDA